MKTSRIHGILSLALALSCFAVATAGAESSASVEQSDNASSGHQPGEITVIKSEPGTPKVPDPEPTPPRRPSTTVKITNLPVPESIIQLSKRPTGPVGWKLTPLGLPRLAPEGFRRGKPVTSSRFEIDQLAPGKAKGQRKAQRADADYLEIDGGESWSRALRGQPREVVFVSFVVYGSPGTEIHVGGARLRVQESAFPGFAEVAIGEPGEGDAIAWKSLDYHVKRGLFSGRELAILPVFTVRLDPANEVWDLYSGIHQVVHHRALVSTRKAEARRFAIEAGSGGAWLCGAVISDENPLFDDDNANGVADEFETEYLGSLQPAEASLASRRELADEWRMRDPRSDPPVFFYLLPQPDAMIPAEMPIGR